jgi:hypothetical protein
MREDCSGLSILRWASVLALCILSFNTTTVSSQDIRPLDWSKLKAGPGNDELAALCASAIEHTQKDLGKNWLGKIAKAKRAEQFFDFGYIEGRGQKYSRRAMENCIRPIAASSRTLALAIRTNQYRADKAGASIAEIEALLPRVARSLAKDHKANGGIGSQTWGDSWQSAMWAAQTAQLAWIIWGQLKPEDRKLIINMLAHEADRFLESAPPTSNKKSIDNTKGEENAWNATCLLTAATMLRNHPHEQGWREQAIVYYLNATATPHDLNSTTLVDGKPLSERLVGYCLTKDYAVGNHKAYPHPGYTASSYLDSRLIFFCTLAGVQPPEALLYNAAPIYRMFVDHPWAAPPYRTPGGTIYQSDGSIYWPVEKEAERAGRYYKWLKQDIMAATYGFDTGCSTTAAVWAKRHGQLIVDALNGKPTPTKLESYHKGAFFKTSLMCYLIRTLHANNHLARLKPLSAASN